MSVGLYLVFGVLIVVAYVLLTLPTWEDRQRDSLRRIRRIGAQVDRQREHLTRSTLEQIQALREEAGRHAE